MALLDREYQRASHEIGEQTIAALGLDPTKQWRVDFLTGIVTDVSGRGEAS